MTTTGDQDNQGKAGSTSNAAGSSAPGPRDDGVSESSLRIPNTRDAINSLAAELSGSLAELRYSETDSFAIMLAFEEAMSNALNHGNRACPECAIEVRYRLDPDEVRLEVRDQGAGFDPAAVPDPTLEANLTASAGRGLLLMRSFMDTVDFNERGNSVTMVRRRQCDRKPVEPDGACDHPA